MNIPRTPREILLARHASARPALDAQHAALLARFTSSRPAARLSPFAFFAVLHRELYAPYRRTWAMLATAWIAILAFQQLDRLVAPPFATGRHASSATRVDISLLALWLEQRRILAALAADTPLQPAPAREALPPPGSPRPLGCIARAPARLALA